MTELRQTVRDSAANANLTPADQAAFLLAQRYAATIDLSPAKLETLGPKLHALLNDLGMTVKGREKLLRQEAAHDTSTREAAAILNQLESESTSGT